jgi:microcystin degradation protein MlrC
VAFKEYPHTDILERAHELVELCLATHEKRIRPVAAVADCRMRVTMHTSRDPARAFVDRIMALEGKDGILSISVTHGFAWGDVPDMGSKVLVYSDGDAAKGRRLAQRLADELTGMRDALGVPYPDIDTALDSALAFDGGPVVLADGADNPGGGAAGDSTFVLKRLLDRGIGNACLGPLWAPGAVRIAFDAGVGAKLGLRVGGKIGPLSGDPLDLQVSVQALHAEMTMTGLSNTPTAMGDCALIETAGVQIVLATIRNQAMGTDLFTQLGVDLAAKKIIVVKSSQHFYASFSKLAKQVIYVGAPGAVTVDLKTLPYRRIRRPLWPID